MVGCYTQRTPHTGVDLDHCAFVWSPGQSFDIGEDRSARLQIKCKHSLIVWPGKFYNISPQWRAAFIEQGIETLCCHIGTIEREHRLVGLKTTPSISQTGIQKCASDALIITHPCRHLFDIRAQAFANLRDLVDEGNLGSQEGV